MKKLLLVCLVLLPSLGNTGQNYIDPCAGVISGANKASSLCGGLLEHWSFEEATDSPRFGSYMSTLLETGVTDVARATPAIKSTLGTYSLDLESTATNKWLWQLGGLPIGSSTIAFWCKPESLVATIGVKQYIANSSTNALLGPSVYLVTTNTVGPKGKVCYSNYELETDTVVTVCSVDDSILPGTAYHVAVGESPYYLGKSRLFLSLNAGAFITTPTAYWTQSGMPLLEIGAYRSKYITSPTFSSFYDGLLDQFLIYNRPLTLAEVGLLNSNGNGLAYPFVTE